MRRRIELDCRPLCRSEAAVRADQCSMSRRSRIQHQEGTFNAHTEV